MSRKNRWKNLSELKSDLNEAQAAYRRLISTSSDDLHLGAEPLIQWLLGRPANYRHFLNFKKEGGASGRIQLAKGLLKKMLSDGPKKISSPPTRSSIPLIPRRQFLNISSRYWELNRFKGVCIWTDKSSRKIESHYPHFFMFLKTHHIPWIFRRFPKGRRQRPNHFFDFNLVLAPLDIMRRERDVLELPISSSWSVYAWDKGRDEIPYHFRHGLSIFDEIWVSRSRDLVDCNRFVENPKYAMSFLQGPLPRSLAEQAMVELQAKFLRGSLT